MIEVLQYYTSSFWVWAGITIGVVGLAAILGETIGSIFKGLRK